MLTQGASGPDSLAQWKKFMDESIEAWSKVLGQAMETEGFAAAMGKFLEQYLSTVGPMRKALQSSNEEIFRTMNLPSRTQVTGLASQVIALEARLEPLEEQIEKLADSLGQDLPSRKQVVGLDDRIQRLAERQDALMSRMDDLFKALADHEAAAAGRAAGKGAQSSAEP
jgi:polyhydroxyalkanoic acid synthase PhaR subunit